MTARLAAALGFALVLSWFAAGPADAQDSRAETLEQARAERAKQLQPYQPGKLERAMLWYERVDPMTRIAPHNGFYVQYGYTDKPVGSGIAFGGGYRRDLFDRRARVDLEAGISFRNYQLLRVDLSAPYLADEKAEIGLEVTYRHHPQEDFYGFGPDSLKDNRVNFLYEHRDVQARALLRPRPWLTMGTRVGVVDPAIGRGTDPRFPVLDQIFDERGAPGSIQQPAFAYGGLFATADTRDQPGNPRDGGYYAIEWRRYDDRDEDRYSFDRTDVEVQHYLPIFDKKRVIALRGRVAATGDSTVPFYFMPTLGGSNTLRSYADYRFRDRNTLLFQVEYRWEAFSGLDMALFSDWGKVAPTAGDLDFTDLRNGYGIGFRFNTYKAIWLRIDIAGGGHEGTRFFFKFSEVF
jgi:hypothetical protein